MRRTAVSALFLALPALAGTPAFAQTGVPATSAPTSATPAPPTGGFRAEFLKHWDDLSKKFVDLAQAMPQEKYTWRPGPGVRSVSEVYLHVAGANFGFMTLVGIQPPTPIDRRTFETSTTDRAKVAEYLRQSFEHVRLAVVRMSDADLDKPAKLFGRDTTVRDVLFTLGSHQPEHLGQSIAYARINGVVPPWTAARQAQQAQQQQPKPQQ